MSYSCRVSHILIAACVTLLVLVTIQLPAGTTQSADFVVFRRHDQTILGNSTASQPPLRLIETHATPCPSKSIQTLRIQALLKSQSQEDVRLLTWFNGLCGGTYLEMGALDGVTFSNSFVFDKAFGWKGLLIELQPSSYEKLKVNRPNNHLVHAGVCETRRKVHYYGNCEPAVAGIVEFAADAFKAQWWPALKPDLSNTQEIDCVPLQDIVESEFGNGTVHFDFFSLDVEGSEFHVLQSVDFDKVSFGIVFVEAHPSNERKNIAVRTFLERQGYRFYDTWQRSHWFIHPEFHVIYGHLLHTTA